MKDLIQIAGVEIKADNKGRFRLNDIHKSSGGENKNRPSLWAENSKTKQLAEIYSKAGFPALTKVKGGKNPGIYATKKMVYSYAMWISPEFNAHVIDTYDEYIQNKHTKETHRIDASAQFKTMQAILQEARKLQGKNTEKHHFTNEARLINWALKGEFKSLNREALTSGDLYILSALEKRNAVLIGINMSYQLRKEALKELVNEIGTPALTAA